MLPDDPYVQLTAGSCAKHTNYCIYSTIIIAFEFLFNLLPEITPCTQALLSWPVLAWLQHQAAALLPRARPFLSRLVLALPGHICIGSQWSSACLVISVLLLRYFTYCTMSYMKSAKTRNGKLLLLLPFSILLELRMTEVVVTTGASWPTNTHPAFYMPHALSVA